ncbi:uncharacterized protein V6R79_002931 [Siganus canaliculatus]
MTPMVHLLLLPLLLSIAAGTDLEEQKGPFENKVLNVQEGTPVPYPIYQFHVDHPVTGFRLSGEGHNDIRMSSDGWLYLERSLDWSRDNHYMITVEAMDDDEVVDGPITVVINVLDVNNNAPFFNRSVYAATVREGSRAGVPFTRVFAFDHDDPTTPNAHLSYSLVSQIPSKQNVKLFQIDSHTGEISTTEEGRKMLKSREGIQYNSGEERTSEVLKAKFNSYCPLQQVPYEQNPFYTCVERQELRRVNVDPLEDPDYTLIVRVQDQEGETETALSGNTRVQIVVEHNLWINPSPITLSENLKTVYPHMIAKVQSNEPDAILTLVQKERELKFPFEISENGEIYVTEELDREEKATYVLVVLAKDVNDREVEPPMEILVLVEDENDNHPVCENEESVFEIQENEPVGSLVGDLLAHDNDEEETLNSLLSYSILSQGSDEHTEFSIDESSGQIRTLSVLRRKEHPVFNFDVKVSDHEFTTLCKVVIKVIDVNDEVPVFELKNYGSHNLSEDTPVGYTVATIKATDDDDPDSGSSLIEFEISSGNDDGFFAVESDGTGTGYLVVAKTLDFETSPTNKLQIDARNPEPLRPGLDYGEESTAFISVTVTDVDESPEFDVDIVGDLNVPENITKGSVLLTVQAKDPEGKDIGFKLEGDSKSWLQIDAATGEIRTKASLDRETLETFDVTVIAFEKAHPEKFSEHVLHLRLQDVNDNVPKLKETQAFICIKSPKPVIIEAVDGDSDPFSGPFTFSLGNIKKPTNWGLDKNDDTSVRLIMKKVPAEEKTFNLPITIKDNAGMGVTQSFEVRVCNCTQLGYCYEKPVAADHKLSMGTTIGILIGVIGFCVVAFIIAVKRSGKKNKKSKNAGEEEQAGMM